MARTSITVTVERKDAENWMFGGSDSEGVDIDASVERYAELAETAIAAAYPDAEVLVDVDAHQQRTSTTVTVEPEDNAIQGWVEELLTRVFNGRYGEYLVMLAGV